MNKPITKEETELTIKNQKQRKAQAQMALLLNCTEHVKNTNFPRSLPNNERW